MDKYQKVKLKLTFYLRSLVSTVAYIQLLSKIFIDSDFCHNYLHTLYLFESL